MSSYKDRKRIRNRKRVCFICFEYFDKNELDGHICKNCQEKNKKKKELENLSKIEKIVLRLKEFSKSYYQEGLKKFPTSKELEFYNRKHTTFSSAMYMPHDELYDKILKKLTKDDIIIDMGSGDFRFPLLASQVVKKVYAIEFNPDLVSNALRIIGYDLPDNLIIICADWFLIPIPSDITFITCLVNNPVIPEQWKKYKLILGELKNEP